MWWPSLPPKMKRHQYTYAVSFPCRRSSEWKRNGMIPEPWGLVHLLCENVVASRFEIEPFRITPLRDTIRPRSHTKTINAWIAWPKKCFDVLWITVNMRCATKKVPWRTVSLVKCRQYERIKKTHTACQHWTVLVTFRTSINPVAFWRLLSFFAGNHGEKMCTHIRGLGSPLF